MENWTKKAYDSRGNASAGGSGPFASGRMQFFPSESKKKKVATHNGNPPSSQQGAGEEPPRTTLSDPMPPGMPSNQIKDDRTKSTGTASAKGNGTRDDDRISHALGTRPGEFF